MDNELTNNKIKVYTTSTPGGLTVSTSHIQQTLGVTNNKAREYADLAKKYRDEAKDLRDDAKYYAEQNADVTMSYVNELEARLQRGIDSKQASGDYALNSSIPTNVSSLTNDSQYVNTTQLGTAIDSVRLPSQTGHDGEFLYTNGETPYWKGVSSLAMFDVIEKDYSLSYAESKGYVQIGEYAYKEAVAGSHYGYQDFYSKCIEEYNNPNNTLEIIKNNYTVVGTPTITSDGIASGFSASNYLSETLDFSNASTWEIQIPFTTGSDITTKQRFFDRYGAAQNLIIAIVQNSQCSVSLEIANGTSIFSASTDKFGITANTDYVLIIGYNGTSYYLKYKVDGVVTTVKTVTSSVKWSSSQIHFLGSNASAEYFRGSIDLKYFLIVIDGIPVLTGNQTGIDTIKPNDYAAPTSRTLPNITDDGIASGFANNKMVQLSNSAIGSSYSTFDVYWKQKFTTLSGAQSLLTTSSGNADGLPLVGGNGLTLYTWGAGKPTLRLSSDGTNNDIANDVVSDIAMTVNTDYYFHFSFDGSSYKLLGSTDGENYTTWITINSSTKMYGLYDFFLGGIWAPQYAVYDLNAFKVYVDGDLVYQPCLKIPYTYSNAERKVVDTAYRSRVQDMYEQFGYTPYYMSDEYTEITTYRAVDCIRTNPNGHKYYDISNKSEIDDIYDDIGEAWYYGIDTINERILLPRTSGINSGKYLYMVVGNTPDWTGVTDLVSQGTMILNQVNTGIANAIETRIDLNVTNISAAGKNTVIEWLLPDYSNGINFTTVPYTAPSNGICYVTTGAANDTAEIKVNNITVGNVGYHDGNQGSLSILVNEGDIVTATSSYSSPAGYFFPLKGV